MFTSYPRSRVIALVTIHYAIIYFYRIDDVNVIHVLCLEGLLHTMNASFNDRLFMQVGSRLQMYNCVTKTLDWNIAIDHQFFMSLYPSYYGTYIIGVTQNGKIYMYCGNTGKNITPKTVITSIGTCVFSTESRVYLSALRQAS